MGQQVTPDAWFTVTGQIPASTTQTIVNGSINFYQVIDTIDLFAEAANLGPFNITQAETVNAIIWGINVATALTSYTFPGRHIVIPPGHNIKIINGSAAGQLYYHVVGQYTASGTG